MIATYIPIAPPEHTKGVEPEKLAACLARYSRNNEGIQPILDKFADKNADAIFKFIDYGHASIGGLTGGIAIAIDQVTMLLACKLFEFAQMADGQESSTRYVTMGVDSLPAAKTLGIPDHLKELWEETCADGFTLYDYCLKTFNELAENEPERLTLPEKAHTDEKLKTRLVKNYGLDRARYFLPLACKTNIAIVATARIWADTVRLLDSLQWPEAIECAGLIRAELQKVAPNLVRHSHPDDASIAFIHDMLREGSSIAASEHHMTNSGKCLCRVQVFNPHGSFNRYNPSAGHALRTRGSRYHHTGTALKRQVVQAEWSHMAIAELRDLNRHRTGFRFSDWGPRGFYIPEETRAILSENSEMDELRAKFLKNYKTLVTEMGRKCQTGLHAYGLFLGTQVPFEHTQHADKFLYEVELRTGLGAHFRYAEHVAQAAELYFQQVPETRDLIVIGNAEQE